MTDSHRNGGVAMEYLLGIDIGTSGTKTVLFDRDANPITAKTFAYPLYQEQNGWAEQEPADWWHGSRIRRLRT